MAGYLRTGPAGGRREPGSRGASLVFRACVSGGGGPWRAHRARALRLLLDLLGPGAEAHILVFKRKLFLSFIHRKFIKSVVLSGDTF